MIDVLTQAKEIRQMTEAAAGYLPDSEAAKMPVLFPAWEADTAYSVGDRREYEDRVYKCRQAHTSQAIYPPDMVPALWEVLDVEHAGTIDDPIPAQRNMEYFKDKYYIEEGVLYLCIRDSETPISYLPSELVGNYFELAEV